MERHQIQYQTVRFNLNGRDVERTVDVRASLTDMLPWRAFWAPTAS